MALIISDCPRCGAKNITFDVKAQAFRHTEYGWRNSYEVFCICRACVASTAYIIAARSSEWQNKFYAQDAIMKFDDNLNDCFEVSGFVSVKDNLPIQPPEFLPDPIHRAFMEGAACSASGCYNAAATMFRLCGDLVTQPLLPTCSDSTDPQSNRKVRRDLGLRLAWMFEHGILPIALRELATCIREDANDGAHAGNLSKEDAEDVLDFTTILLERLITEPKRLEAADARRKARRSR